MGGAARGGDLILLTDFGKLANGSRVVLVTSAPMVGIVDGFILQTELDCGFWESRNERELPFPFCIIRRFVLAMKFPSFPLCLFSLWGTF